MKTAREMFEDLGFVYKEEIESNGKLEGIIYKKEEKKLYPNDFRYTKSEIVVFNINNRTYASYECRDDVWGLDKMEVDIPLSKAIQKQQEELGWLL